MRLRAIPYLLVDFSLLAGLAVTGMILVLAIAFVGTELARVDLLNGYS